MQREKSYVLQSLLAIVVREASAEAGSKESPGWLFATADSKEFPQP